MLSAVISFTGNGPSSRTLMFNSDENSYEIWKKKLISHLRKQKVHKYVLNRNDELLSGPVAVGANAAAIAITQRVGTQVVIPTRVRA